VEAGQPRIILVEVSEASREVMVGRLSAQGYAVEAAADPASGADMALASPPAAVIADLWMPSISGVQLCRLLKAEPATMHVPVILRGDNDDPRSRFWAERAGAVGYVRKGRMGELVRVLSRAVKNTQESDGFFMQLSGGSIDIRDRIARYLDAALFDSVIAAEVRSLAASGSFERLFDLFAQFLCQVLSYRWVALRTGGGFALHYHPNNADNAEREARTALGLAEGGSVMRVVDEDAHPDSEGAHEIVCSIQFGNTELGQIALSPSLTGESDAERLMELVARELGGPLRMASLMEEQQRLASIDPLTGLCNRRAFLERAGIEVARSTRYDLPLCMLLMDVDHFKSINDGFGHGGGDQVLSAMGAALKRILRIPDIAARWGGEEFVVALPSTDAEGAKVAAERVRTAIEALVVEHEGKQIRFTASIGVAALKPGESLASLVDRADHAMYAAKVGGRNRVCVAASESEPPSSILKATQLSA
jgi:two-component system, cell cycle response regulator